MKYIIYGINRVAKDFLYIFNGLDILCLTDEGTVPGETLWGGYVTRRLEDVLDDASCVHALDDVSCGRIILCDFDKSGKEEKLRARGLAYGKDYVYEEDFFLELDDFQIPRDRKLAVWGTGNMCGFLLGHRIPWKIDFFIDSYKAQDTFQGKPVLSPEEVSDWGQCYVITAVAQDGEIKKRLLAQDLKEKEDFASYRQILELPSMLLRETIFDRSCYSIKCGTMGSHLEILAEGETRTCCTTFVSHGIANIFSGTPEEVWQSAHHRILCLSTENRTFSFCDKSMCPLFVGLGRGDSPGTVGKEPYQEMTHRPETVALGYDSSCNLSCTTCRQGLHYAQGEELETVERITEKVIADYLPGCKFLIMAGSGEVFASPAYRKVYESETCSPQYIRLLSNGTLFTPANWEGFIRGKKADILLTVSVDAATEGTYRKIRRGGSFRVLKKNMEFAAKLRKSGGLRYFRMNFVVQRENYKEMIPFVEWGLQLGVDEVFFTKILNWGTYTEEEFAQVSMMELDGVTPKPELMEVLNHPVMKSSIVDMGTIQYGHKKDEIDRVENYYMWELEKRGGKIFL